MTKYVDEVWRVALLPTSMWIYHGRQMLQPPLFVREHKAALAFCSSTWVALRCDGYFDV